MTIAAGFVCINGLVLCADTEMTGNVRSGGQKAWYRHDSESSIALVGAGSAALIRMIRNRLFERINPDTSLRDAEIVIEQTLRMVYKDHIDNDPTNDLDVAVLVGVRHRRQCKLFEHDRTVVADVDNFASVGTGGGIADYLSVALFERSTVLAASTFASYVLQQCKRFAPNCGGESHIILMPSDGVTEMGTQSRVEHSEKVVAEAFAGVRHALKTQLLEVGIPDGAVGFHGLASVVDIKPTVKIEDQAPKVRLDPEDPTDGLSGQPPSPE